MTAKALDPIKAKTRLGNALREYKKNHNVKSNAKRSDCWHSLRIRLSTFIQGETQVECQI